MDSEEVGGISGPDLHIGAAEREVTLSYAAEPVCYEGMVVVIWRLESVEEDSLGQVVVLFCQCVFTSPK